MAPQPSWARGWTGLKARSAEATDTPMSEPEKKKPKPLQKIKSTCVDVVRNTPDTVTLFFDTGDTPDYQAGQFISIDPHQFAELTRVIAYFEHVKGKREPFRAYSMSSAPSERWVSITVKAEPWHKEDKYPPILSPFLASEHLKGRPVMFTGYTGPYVLDEGFDHGTDVVVHIVAGSGVVPNYALLKDELLCKKNLAAKHVMIDVNKTFDDIIFAAELADLAEKYPERFTLVHCITREADDAVAARGPMYRKGRPTIELLRSYIPDPTRALVFACGAAITKYQRAEAKLTGVEPAPRFMEGVQALVAELGLPEDRFHSEEYG
jgi:3-ketosteroid 9alpha-monooxygenase subunit B